MTYNFHHILSGKTRMKENNIKVHLKETGYEGAHWILSTSPVRRYNLHLGKGRHKERLNICIPGRSTVCSCTRTVRTVRVARASM